jgi:KaiC/GvpD/RAD55 family RecA-like ATPase
MKTAQPPVSAAAIPQLLRDTPRWICWDYMDSGDGKKPRKVPLGKGTDYGTNYNDPSAWRTFSSVMTEASEREGVGIGFVFSDTDDIVGIDLDNSYDEQGWLKPWAREIAKYFSGAFCEQTPSGLGLHFIGRASKVVGRTRVELPDGDGGIERYSENRWFTFTGNPVTDGDIVDIFHGMAWLEEHYFGGRRHSPLDNTPTHFETDAELNIELARVCFKYMGSHRATSGDDWRAVGYACKGTSESLRDDWIRWSAQWNGFSLDECQDRWSRFDSRSSVGTLVYMAAADSGISSQAMREEARQRLGRNAPQPEEDPTPTLLDAIKAWREQEETPALPTGIPALDKLFGGGLPLGQMTAIAAAPGLGKSALALQLVLQCLGQNPEMVAAWCLGEMTRAALAARAITNFGGQPEKLTLQDVIQKREPSDRVASDLGAAIGNRLKLIEAPLIIDRIERAVTKDGPTLLIVDYLQLVRSTRHFNDKTGEINEVLLKLREITTTRNIATLLVTNIAKGCDASTEIGNIGKGSNQIDFDVDNFLFGHRIGETGEAGEIKIEWKCKKLRQGQMADVEMWFHGQYQYFEDACEIPDFPEFSGHAPTQNWGAV